jgi:hypothetical protein
MRRQLKRIPRRLKKKLLRQMRRRLKRIPRQLKRIPRQLKRISRRLKRIPRRLSRTSSLQNFWFLTGVPARRIGYGRGLLTWMRVNRHRRLRRRIHIVLLDPSGEGKFGSLQAFWINKSCSLCSASLNERLEDADVAWIFSQDPLSPDSRSKLLNSLREAKPGARIINHPDVYNNYHKEDAFERLAAAGVSVPRATFSQDDLRRTTVVYKRTGQHHAPKTLEQYSGPRAGYTAFEFIDSRGPDGLYRRYRAYYIVGIVSPYKLYLCKSWNVYGDNDPRIQYTFDMTPEEIRQVRTIADVFKLQYFEVDFLRRSGDGKPFFFDVNIYPNNRLPASTVHDLGYYENWHTFDARQQLQIAELPGGKHFADIFDEAMLHFVEGRAFPSDPNFLC